MNRLHRANPLSAVALAAGLVLAGCGQPAARTTLPSPVYVTTVRAGAGQDERLFTATVRARVETELGFRTGGKVAQRLVEVGDRVVAGQPLARLDAADPALAVEAAADQLKAATVDAEQSASDEGRLRRLLADGSVGAADHERQKARADAAAARVDLARRQLALARNRDAYTTLTAPYAGVVTSVRLEAGQVVAEGQPVLSLARDGEREVVADLPESLASEARGFKAQAAPWSGTGPTLDLQLRELAPLASPQGRTYRVKYAADAAPAARAALAQLPLGSTAQLRLVRPGGARTSLPPAALVKASGAAGVWAIDQTGDGLQFVAVKVLRHEADSVEVQALPQGLRVVSVGAQKLDATMKVRPLERATIEAGEQLARSQP
jgi:RND family efflux transporter MFP subunit